MITIDLGPDNKPHFYEAQASFWSEDPPAYLDYWDGKGTLIVNCYVFSWLQQRIEPGDGFWVLGRHFLALDYANDLGSMLCMLDDGIQAHRAYIFRLLLHQEMRLFWIAAHKTRPTPNRNIEYLLEREVQKEQVLQKSTTRHIVRNVVKIPDLNLNFPLIDD